MDTCYENWENGEADLRLVYSWIIVVRERAPCNTCSRIDTRHVVEYGVCMRTTVKTC
jgi:hypothetical protein